MLVTLIKPNNEHFANYIPLDISVKQFNFERTIQAFRPLISFIRHENPHIVFSTLTHLNFILGIVKLFVNRKILFVARESSIVSSSLKDEKFSSLFRLLYRWTYKNLNLVICQSNVMADDLIKNFRINPASVKVIYNPIDFDFIAAKTDSFVGRTDGKTTQLLCVGRLYAVKGYDRLFQALKLLQRIDYHLKIVGGGPLRHELEELAMSLGLSNKVSFLGVQENPYQFMVQADCLLLSSYYEGLPNAVLEANACGLPVVAFNAPGGTAEIVEDGINGWLIPDGDLQAFARKVESRDYLVLDRSKIKEFVAKRFSLDKITTQYEQAILDLRKL